MVMSIFHALLITGVVDYYSIYRSVSNMNNFNKIGEIPYDGQENIFYTDNTALTSKIHTII